MYNESDKSLQVHKSGEIVRTAAATKNNDINYQSPTMIVEEDGFCSHCGRPWTTNNTKNNSNNNNNNTNNNHNNKTTTSLFVDRNYFKLLDLSSRPQSLEYSPKPKAPTQRSPTLTSKRSNSKSKSKLSASYIHLEEDDELKDQDAGEEAAADGTRKNLLESSINQGYYGRFFIENDKLGRGSGGSVFKW